MNEIDKVAESFRVSDEIALFTAPSLCTIIDVQSADHGELIGTGTFIRHSSRVYIVTARHVAEKACQSNGCAHSCGPGQRPRLITRPFVIHKDRALDLALLPIEPSDIGDSPIRPLDFSVLAESSDDLADFLVIHGYPGERSRFSAIGRGIFSTSQPYVTVEGRSSLPEFNPAIHFAIEYPGEGQEDPTGRSAKLPDPHGMSGTAVWRSGRAKAGKDWTSANARIVGIVHRWDQDSSSLVATRIEPLSAFLQQVEADGA